MRKRNAMNDGTSFRRRSVSESRAAGSWRVRDRRVCACAGFRTMRHPTRQTTHPAARTRSRTGPASTSSNSAAGRAVRRRSSTGRSVGRGGGWFGQRGSSGKSIYASNVSMLSVGQNMVSGGAFARNSLLRIILTMQSLFKARSLPNFRGVVFRS
jgi:hypothetical protein